jgi:hypothetical protein
MWTFDEFVYDEMELLAMLRYMYAPLFIYLFSFLPSSYTSIFVHSFDWAERKCASPLQPVK